MTYLPASDPIGLWDRQPRSDMLAMGARTNARFDRLLLNLVAGLFTIVAAMAGFLLAVL
jgi:hypothetical protein